MNISFSINRNGINQNKDSSKVMKEDLFFYIALNIHCFIASQSFSYKYKLINQIHFKTLINNKSLIKQKEEKSKNINFD